MTLFRQCADLARAIPGYLLDRLADLVDGLDRYVHGEPPDVSLPTVPDPDDPSRVLPAERLRRR